MRLRKREKSVLPTAVERRFSGRGEAPHDGPGGPPAAARPDGAAPAPAPSPAAPGELPAPPEVTLTDGEPAVSLAGDAGASGLLRIELNRQRSGRHGDDGVRLDLCALFELTDGSKGVVQPLGGAYGSLHRPPFMLLGGSGHPDGLDGPGHPDGADPAREHLTVNLDHVAAFRRVLVFVTLYGGAAGFTGLLANVTLRPENGAGIRFGLDECAVESTVCALALVVRTGPDLVVRREARFLVPRAGISPQRTVDYAYGWGLDWTPGHR